MSTQSVTLHLPEPLYRQLHELAARTHRTIEAETLALLVTALPEPEDIPAEVKATLDSMALLDDEELWRAAQSRLSAETADTLEELKFKRQREGLTDAERQKVATILREYDRAMLIRAQAAVLLKQRGHDISSLLTPP